MNWAAAAASAGGSLKKKASSKSDDLMGIETESQRTRYSLAEEELVELVHKKCEEAIESGLEFLRKCGKMEDFALKIEPFTTNLTYHLQKLSGDFPKKAKTEELSFRVQQIIDRISGIVNVQLKVFPIFRGIFEMTMTIPKYEEVYQEMLTSSREELLKMKDSMGKKDIPMGWTSIENFGGIDFLQGTKSVGLLEETLETLLDRIIERTVKANEALQMRKNALMKALAEYNLQVGESLDPESQKNYDEILEALNGWKWRSTSEITVRMFGDQCSWDEKTLSLEVAGGTASVYFLQKPTFTDALTRVTKGRITSGKGGKVEEREEAKKETERPLKRLNMMLMTCYSHGVGKKDAVGNDIQKWETRIDALDFLSGLNSWFGTCCSQIATCIRSIIGTEQAFESVMSSSVMVPGVGIIYPQSQDQSNAGHFGAILYNLKEKYAKQTPVAYVSVLEKALMSEAGPSLEMIKRQVEETVLHLNTSGLEQFHSVFMLPVVLLMWLTRHIPELRNSMAKEMRKIDLHTIQADADDYTHPLEGKMYLKLLEIMTEYFIKQGEIKESKSRPVSRSSGSDKMANRGETDQKDVFAEKRKKYADEDLVTRKANKTFKSDSNKDVPYTATKQPCRFCGGSNLCYDAQAESPTKGKQCTKKECYKCHLFGHFSTVCETSEQAIEKALGVRVRSAGDAKKAEAKIDIARYQDTEGSDDDETSVVSESSRKSKNK